MDVEFKSSWEKTTKNIPIRHKKEFAIIIDKIITCAATNRIAGKQKIEGQKNHYRIRSKDKKYRLIFEKITSKKIIMLGIKKRDKNTYK